MWERSLMERLRGDGVEAKFFPSPSIPNNPSAIFT